MYGFKDAAKEAEWVWEKQQILELERLEQERIRDNIIRDKTSCLGCKHVDEYFGDCCHPLSGGCQDLTWARKECGDKHKFKEI